MQTQKSKVLIVDDEPDILEFMQYNLRKEGYDVFTASNGLEGLKIAKAEVPNLIILDIMMPEMDGIETCKNLKQIPSLENTIITFLTARNEDYSQIAGFDVGADDYIAKPIKPKVLTSRIKALLRRTEKKQEVDVIEIGDLKIDRDRYLIIQNGKEIELPRKEFELLSLLLSKPGKVFKRDHIMDMVWGEDVVVGDRTIDVHIRKLREKLGDELIKTVKGIGYKFDLN